MIGESSRTMILVFGLGQILRRIFIRFFDNKALLFCAERMSATQQLILRVTEELAQQIRVVVEQHSDVSEQTPLIVEIEPEIESGRRL